MGDEFPWLFDADAHRILFVLRRHGSATLEGLHGRCDVDRRRLKRLLHALHMARVVGAETVLGPGPVLVKYELTRRGIALTEVFLARAREARKHVALLGEWIVREVEGPWRELDRPNRNSQEEW